jgi:arylsulfatase A-like enzyme
MIPRRSFLKGTIAALLGGALAERRALAANPPNVLFVQVDQWRAQSFSQPGQPDPLLPKLNRFAGQSCQWTRAYTVSPKCSPNRASIITGRYAHQHGVTGNNIRLLKSETGIAQVFRRAGYRTHWIGKWHLDGKADPGFVPRKRRQGFRTFRGFNRGHDYLAWVSFTNSGAKRKFTQYQPIKQTDWALSFLEKHGHEPFFLFLAWGPPHPPYKAPKRYKELVPGSFPVRPNVPDSFAESDQIQKWLRGEATHRVALDQQFGRLMRGLRDLNLKRKTIVVFTSDHGDLLGSHTPKQRKGQPFEEAVRVPLLFRWPGVIPRGSVEETPISSADIMPTLLSLCGLSVSTPVAGQDLSGVMLADQPGPDTLYYQGGFGKSSEWRAVVTESDKLVLRLNTGRVSLYDLINDPFELIDLGTSPLHQARVDELRDELRRLADDLNDPILLP